jgi:hypothetical protein
LFEKNWRGSRHAAAPASSGMVAAPICVPKGAIPVTSDTRSSRSHNSILLQRRIVAYLASHPQALDTVDGIALWWVESDRRVVEPALAQLERRGIVRRRELGAAVYYALHPRHHGHAADEILAAAAEDGGHGRETRSRRR